MGLLRNVRNRSEQRDTGGFGEYTARIPAPWEGARSYAGPQVSPENSLLHIDVYKCRSLIADVMAMLPLRAYRSMARVNDATGLVETFPVPVPTQPQLLTDPMPLQVTPQWDLMHSIMDSLLGDGNAYIEVCAVDQFGYPTVVCPVDPVKVRDVTLDRAGHTVFTMHDGAHLGGVRDGGTMIHITAYKRAGSLKGLGPILAGKQGIALSMAAEQFGARFFGDGANPSGYLKTDAPIDEQEAIALKRKWIQTYGNLNREPAVLYGGMTWNPISVTPEESQFIETRKFQSGQIAALFRIPPHLVGDVDKSTSWGTGIEEMGLGFVTYCLGPWMSRIEQAFSYLLPRGQFARFDVSELLRGRAAEQATLLTQYRQWGVLSVNEIRCKLDMPPIEGGDVYLQPLNMIDAEYATEMQMDTAEPAGEAPDPEEGEPVDPTDMNDPADPTEAQ